MTQHEFSSLKAQLLSGNNEFLTVIFETHSAYCIRLLVSKYNCLLDDAEDIYVDAVMNFREKMIRHDIEALTDVRAYLFATCRNMFFARLKRDERTMRAVREVHMQQDSFALESPGESCDGYMEGLEKVVETALAAIPDKCKDILKAFYFEKLDLTQIAAKMGFASANVTKVIKARCFKKLVTEVKIISGRVNENEYHVTNRG